MPAILIDTTSIEHIRALAAVIVENADYCDEDLHIRIAHNLAPLDEQTSFAPLNIELCKFDGALEAKDSSAPLHSESESNINSIHGLGWVSKEQFDALDRDYNTVKRSRDNAQSAVGKLEKKVEGLLTQQRAADATYDRITQKNDQLRSSLEVAKSAQAHIAVRASSIDTTLRASLAAANVANKELTEKLAKTLETLQETEVQLTAERVAHKSTISQLRLSREEFERLARKLTPAPTFSVFHRVDNTLYAREVETVTLDPTHHGKHYVVQVR